MSALTHVLENMRVASTHDQKILEAAKVFGQGLNGHSPTAKAALQEAFTTSDFPNLLGDAFEREARSAYREVADETTLIARPEGVSDVLKPKKLLELWGETYFEDLAEGEGYKADNPFKESEIEVTTGKTGRNYGLSMERWHSGDFADLADFPGLLGRGAANTRNRKVYRNLVSEDGTLNTDFFSEVDNAALGYNSLIAALDHLRGAEDHYGEGDLVDGESPVLIVGPALREAAEALTSVRTIRETTEDGDVRRETERANRLNGIQVQVSREFSKLLATGLKSTAWALVPRAQADTGPPLVRTYWRAFPELDLRVRNDQGDRIGGGGVQWSEGSFDNDTIWYRGRLYVGGSQAFTQGTYGSTGDA